MKDLATGKYDTFVRIDVKDFYPTIEHDVLISALSRKIRKKEVLRLVRRAISTPTAPDRAPRPRALRTKGVPQGLSISNPLAEIYLQPVDRVMVQEPDISYHRFVDDILILCSEGEAMGVDASCRAALTQIELTAHPCAIGGKSEIGSTHQGFSYLGYTFSSGGVTVRRSSITRLESHLASIHATWRREVERGVPLNTAHRRFMWQRNLAITGCIFQGVASGWIQYFRQLDDLTLLKRLDATIVRLGTRYAVPETPRPKTFMRAYWAIQHPRSRNLGYVPNYDLYDIKQMTRELSQMGTDTTTLTDQEVKDVFYRMVSRAVRDLERDIGDLS